MKIETFACDECGKRRDSDANHWWLAIIHSQATRQAPGAEYRVINSEGIDLIKWNKELASGNFREQVSHLCGQSCVIAAVNRFMSEGKLEK